MTIDVRQDDEIQEAIRNLFIGSVPERRNELSDYWKKLELVFQLLPDVHEDGRIIMDAGCYRYLRFNHRVLRAFWIGAFAAWEGYRAVYESKDIWAVGLDLARFQELIASFSKTIENYESENEPLPQGIPEPGALPDKTSDPQGRVASELVIIALGWALLHEVRHIKHQHDGTSASVDDNKPECARREEFSSDEFATTFILECIQRYADDSGYDVKLVRRKREMAIYFALFTLTLLAKDRWGESDTHPSVQARIDAVCDLMGEERDEVAEAIAYTAFVTLRTLWPSAPMIAFARSV